jgi:hypothetical protein
MPPPNERQRIEYRSKAQAHVKAARRFLRSSDDPFAPIYACLQARFALEALAYDRLQDYLFEVSAEAMNGWTPKAVLNELLYADPDACSPIALTFGWRPDPNAPEQEIHLGESYRFSAIWANKMHHALSSFLHQSTIKQTTTMGEPGADTGQRARETSEEALQELDRVLASSVTGFRAHHLVRTQCKCGSQIARDLEFIEAGKIVACSACGRLYNLRHVESRDGFEFWPQQASWTCVDCKTFNSMDAYELKSAKIVECSGCHEQFKLETKPILTRIVSPAEESEDEHRQD